VATGVNALGVPDDQPSADRPAANRQARPPAGSPIRSVPGSAVGRTDCLLPQVRWATGRPPLLAGGDVEPQQPARHRVERGRAPVRYPGRPDHARHAGAPDCPARLRARHPRMRSVVPHLRWRRVPHESHRHQEPPVGLSRAAAAMAGGLEQGRHLPVQGSRRRQGHGLRARAPRRFGHAAGAHPAARLRSLRNCFLAPPNANSSVSAAEQVHENTIRALLEGLARPAQRPVAV
jgi:hypothetical protein